MNPVVVSSWVLRLLGVCYGYSLLLATGNVVNCELRKPMACGQQWTQAFTVAGSTAGTLLAYFIDSPAQVRRQRQEDER
jgi:hypothetical protein